MPGVSKIEQSQRTRRVLLDTARRLFAESGYAGTSTEEIVQQANMTRGALYYHYRDKADIFRAVFEEVRMERVQFIMENIQANEGGIWQKFVLTGLAAFIENMQDPVTQRIVFVDGPAVLGLDAVRDNAPGLVFMRNTLTQFMDTGEIEQMPVGPLSAILWAGVFEAGMYIAQADPDDTARTQEEVTEVLLRVFSGLRPAPQQEASERARLAHL